MPLASFQEQGMLLLLQPRLGTGGSWGVGTAAAPHLPAWPRAQHLGRPASSLILLGRGDPAFCQSGSRQRSKGWGGGVLLSPGGPGTPTSVLRHRPPLLTREQTGRGAGVGEHAQGEEESTSRRRVQQEALNPPALARASLL